MGLSGVYKMMVLEFNNYYAMELHVKQEYRKIQATLKDGVLDRTFYNGSVNGTWDEDTATSFVLRNAQIDNYVDMKVPGHDEPVNLTPPGGFHIGGVTMCATVVEDSIVGTIHLQGDLVISFTGKRIPGREPEVNDNIRKDARYGKNRYCTCGTGSCTHNGYCDSCNLFESFICTQPLNEDGTPKGPAFPMGMMMQNGRLPATQCMNKQQDELFGPMQFPKMADAPKPRLNPDGTKFREHGPHHLKADAEFGVPKDPEE